MYAEPKTERDELINPYWIEDKDLKRGEVDYLSGPEIQFWKDLLDKYLYPIDENKEQQVNEQSPTPTLMKKHWHFFRKMPSGGKDFKKDFSPCDTCLEQGVCIVNELVLLSGTRI